MFTLDSFGGRAHPRSRGENLICRSTTATEAGSSPLTRGKQLRVVGEPHDDGLIPAHAGKTCGADPLSAAQRAHPRSRGENGVKKYQIDWGQGSSPLTRGKRTVNPRLTAATGLIPAHAGKTSIPSRTDRGPGAHPRSRGENAASSWGGRQFPGSSPLTRGKRPR